MGRYLPIFARGGQGVTHNLYHQSPMLRILNYIQPVGLDDQNGGELVGADPLLIQIIQAGQIVGGNCLLVFPTPALHPRGQGFQGGAQVNDQSGRGGESR